MSSNPSNLRLRPSRGNEILHILDEKPRLLHRGEMPARVVLAVPDQVTRLHPKNTSVTALQNHLTGVTKFYKYSPS